MKLPPLTCRLHWALPSPEDAISRLTGGRRGQERAEEAHRDAFIDGCIDCGVNRGLK